MICGLARHSGLSASDNIQLGLFLGRTRTADLNTNVPLLICQTLYIYDDPVRQRPFCFQDKTAFSDRTWFWAFVDITVHKDSPAFICSRVIKNGNVHEHSLLSYCQTKIEEAIAECFLRDTEFMCHLPDDIITLNI